ncbi:MAG: glycosyltransferase family 4 protein [Acidobacteriota bacterium]
MFRDIYDLSNLRVAYFAASMQPGLDGVTRVLYNLIDELNKRGIQNVFFSAVNPPVEDRPTKMFTVPSFAFPLYKEYKISLPPFSSLREELQKFNPDIIHFNSPCPLGYAAARAGAKLKVPTVATYHTHFASYAKYYRVQALESYGWSYFRKLYNKCRTVYVPSNPIIKILRSHGINNLTLLPHGVDSEMFSPRFRSEEWRRSLGLENKTVILYAGRLVWEKDLLTFANASRIISGRRDDIVFVLAGDGPVKNELEKMMPGAVFLGYQKGKSLSTAFASSDVFVFPSTTETFGNVTLEAMASGIPAICVREGGAYDVIQDEVTGLIAEPRDAGDLSRKILRLANDRSGRLEMGRRAYDYAIEQTWSNIFSRLFDSYLEVVNRSMAVKEAG